MTPVLWFLGLSASGKSTISSLLYEKMKKDIIFKDVKKWQLIDGDIIREFLGNEIGYSCSERRKSVRIVGLLAKTLSENNIGVIVANISPFHDLRKFFRNNINGYMEFYCKCDIESCIKRDPKKHYKNQMENGIKDFVGLDIPFQEPLCPELVLETDEKSIDECLSETINYLKHIQKNFE